ncbi:uncharacterized protein K452DRAFT_315301 [Aplosporella prunicola CBS 121167]|uniref:Uncharacterized protein n=1 Tax=Aplosporella prunicola CBS 121167 TaxID=1176127 RepID=A0A6A6BPH9_9PEZI|nr:uncharacterized protein K452DRAFT_315301 [Aplosporella prunicola CBS 121167]KAF2146039.1 hypothetical protein K452DRAFT_315301 [Aplosporella prunicola CBS 121167]
MKAPESNGKNENQPENKSKYKKPPENKNKDKNPPKMEATEDEEDDDRLLGEIMRPLTEDDTKEAPIYDDIGIIRTPKEGEGGGGGGGGGG